MSVDRYLTPITIIALSIGVQLGWSAPMTPSTPSPLSSNHESFRFAFEHAAAAYSNDPQQCARKYNGTVLIYKELPCDRRENTCAAFISETDEWIVVSFRGTNGFKQLSTEIFDVIPPPDSPFEGGGFVESYFDNAYKVFWEEFMNFLLTRVQRVNQTVLFTGHSLGGAMASLASSSFALTMQKLGLNPEIRLITFGQPRVGNFDYAKTHMKLVPESFRLVNRRDLVAHIPTCRVDWWHRCNHDNEHSSYHHGTEIWYDKGMHEGSEFKVCIGNPIYEDAKCSDGLHFYNIYDHIHYFNVRVSHYGKAGCSESTLVPDEEENLDIHVKNIDSFFLKNFTEPI